jgi:hypothetical protein
MMAIQTFTLRAFRVHKIKAFKDILLDNEISLTSIPTERYTEIQ